MLYVGSLFSGIGGIELGFERAGGYETRWFVENNPYASHILKQKWPKTPVYGDITKIDFAKLPKVDVLAGGFPCQDISNAGKRVGIEGSRSGLWKHYCEAIRQLRPKVAFIENVSALLNRGLGVVLADLCSLGYDAEWHCVPASAVGAPHQRDRVFIIAYRTDYVADSEQQRQVSCEYEKWSRPAQELFKRSSADVADTSSWKLERVRSFGKQKLRPQHKETKPNGSSQKWREGWWAVEPELGRVAHGIPNRVDRIKCLGNAVVPQVAQVFAEAISRGDRK